MLKRTSLHHWKIAGLLVFCLLPVSCDYPVIQSHLETIQTRGELRILTRNAPTSYYENADGQFEGPEYEMATAFARYLNVKPVFVVKNTAADLLGALESGEADFIAAGLTKTDKRTNSYQFGPDYRQVQQQVICRRNNGPVPKSLTEMESQRLWVSALTSYEHELTKRLPEFPYLDWTSSEDLDTENLLEMVWKREIDCTVSDSNIFAINRRYYPELVLAFSLTPPENLSWVLPSDSDQLAKAMHQWFRNFEESGQMATLNERYYGFVDEDYDYVDTRRFRRAVYGKLPAYRQWFEEAAAKHGLDWILLAAVSYQESHWDPRAKSPTGVRGIMMITQATARQLGLENRLDPEASIFAGARYLARLRERIPAHIEEPQRTWMALTAYNMGFGHFRDARTLAEQLDKDPDRWDQFQSILPLLSRKKYYTTLKHGYARGGQALHYVSKIRDYRDQLSGLLAREAADKQAK